MVAKFSRKGLHRVRCESCDGAVYVTIAQLEQRGMPACWCGAAMTPDRVELALALGLDDHPAVLELQARTHRKEVAQMPKAKRPCQMSSSLANMAERALDEIRAEQRREARTRRIAAILPTPAPIPF